MGQSSTCVRGNQTNGASTFPQQVAAPWPSKKIGDRDTFLATGDYQNGGPGKLQCWYPGQKLVTTWKFVGDGHGAYAPVQYGFVGEGAGCYEQEVVAVVSDDAWSKVLLLVSIVVVAILSAVLGVACVKVLPSLLVWAPQSFQALVGTLKRLSTLSTHGAGFPEAAVTLNYGRTGAGGQENVVTTSVARVRIDTARIYDCTLPTAPPVLPAPLGSKVVASGRRQPVYTLNQQKKFGVDERGNPSGGILSRWPLQKRLYCCKSHGVACMTVSDVAPPN